MARRITERDLDAALETFAHAVRSRVDDYKGQGGYHLDYAYGEVAVVYSKAGESGQSTIFSRDNRRAIYNQLNAAAVGVERFLKHMDYPASPLEGFRN